MLLTINHTTNYEYNDNLLGLIQTTKLTPSPYNGLKIIEWSVKRNNKEGGVVYTGNADVLKQVCPGVYGKIKKQGFCMIGN